MHSLRVDGHGKVRVLQIDKTLGSEAENLFMGSASLEYPQCAPAQGPSVDTRGASGHGVCDTELNA